MIFENTFKVKFIYELFVRSGILTCTSQITIIVNFLDKKDCRHKSYPIIDKNMFSVLNLPKMPK